VPTRYPKESRNDVIAVARRGDRSIAKVSRSFGISESCLARWLRIADREDGLVSESSASATAGELEAENCERSKGGSGSGGLSTRGWFCTRR
jgi:transposase-like protein